MIKYLSIFLLYFNISAFSQAFNSSNIGIINSSNTNMFGINTIIPTDLNNDGQLDLIVSQGSNISKISALYNNSGTFQTRTTIDDAVYYVEKIGLGDFNNDGLKDIVSVNRQYGDIKWHPNSTTGFSSAITIDQNIFFLNDVEVYDFDNDGYDDFVAIGQHTITLYKNNQNSGFTKLPILTTSTSPNSLECMYLDIADLDLDGDMDLVGGETIGPVVYYNNGLDNFTPQIAPGTHFTTSFNYPIDVNNDGYPDLLIQDSTAAVRLHINNGNGAFAPSSLLFQLQNSTLESITTLDINADGYLDIIYGYYGKVVYRLNTGTASFGPEVVIINDATQFYSYVTTADLDNDNIPELLFSATNGDPFYVKFTPLSLKEFTIENINIFPNPSSNIVYFQTEIPIETITIFSSLGQKIKTVKNSNYADISELSQGIYLVEIASNEKTIYKKIVKK